MIQARPWTRIWAEGLSNETIARQNRHSVTLSPKMMLPSLALRVVAGLGGQINVDVEFVFDSGDVSNQGVSFPVTGAPGVTIQSPVIARIPGTFGIIGSPNMLMPPRVNIYLDTAGAPATINYEVHAAWIEFT